VRARRPAAALALALALATASASALAATCPRTSLAEIENEVMCPVCKTPLALAQDPPQAKRERAFILERVERCQSKDEIKAALAAEFGDEVLAMPQRKGFDLAAYLVPALALAVGLATAAAATMRWRRHRPRPAQAAVLVASEPGGGAAPAEAAGAETASDASQRPSEPSAAARLERELEHYDA